MLDLTENRGTGRRKAGYDLKDRIDVGRNRAGQIKRQRADQGHHDPAQCTDDEALTRIIVGTLRPPDRGQGADDERKYSRNCEGLHGPEFLIDQCADDRQDHDAGFELQHPSEHVNNHTKVHFPNAPYARISLRSLKPVFVVITMTLSPGSMKSAPRGVMIWFSRTMDAIRTFFLNVRSAKV